MNEKATCCSFGAATGPGPPGPCSRSGYTRRLRLPQGTRLELEAEGWRQTGHFASSTGVPLIPHEPAQHVEVGFMQTRSGWHVTFMEPQ